MELLKPEEKERHGGPFDRGSADSWYRRSPDPHYWTAGSYGGEQGLFEIMLMRNDNPISLPPITEEGDTIKGFLTEEQVNSIIADTRDLPGTF
jgi:hypothetical protein